jgi:hypothetical protein
MYPDLYYNQLLPPCSQPLSRLSSPAGFVPVPCGSAYATYRSVWVSISLLALTGLLPGACNFNASRTAVSAM